MVMFDLWYFVYMLGFSMCFANTMTCGMAVLPPELKADGNALFNTFQQLSGAVATTVMAVFLGVAQAGHGSAGDVEFVTATQSGAHWGFVFLAVVMACAMLADLRAFASKR